MRVEAEKIGLDAGTSARPRGILARTVREQCLAREPGESQYELRGMRIGGALRLADAVLDRPVRFVECEFTDEIDLRGASAAKGIHLDRCRLGSLRADRLRVNGDLLLENVRATGEVSLCGARLTGHLRCTGSEFLRTGPKAFNAKGMVVCGSVLLDAGVRLAGELVLDSARVDGSVDLTGVVVATAGGDAIAAGGIRVGVDLLMSGARADGPVTLADAHVAGGMRLDHGSFTGEVRLSGAVTDGGVSCGGGAFTNPGGIALGADGIRCQDMWLDRGFVAKGEVRLIGATITRELNCTSGVFDSGRGRDALKMDGFFCGKVFLNEDFRAVGEVCLCNARIATELNCTHGTFDNHGHIALRAGGFSCDGNVYLNERFVAGGRMDLQDVTVRRDLNCGNGRFDEVDGQRLTVGGTFDWRPRAVPAEVDLSFATVGLLRDRPGSWPTEKRTRLVGLTITSVDDDEMPAGARISWLADAKEYAPEVYQQLVRIYRQCGKVRDSHDMAIANQKARRRRGDMPRWARVWNWFLGWSVGYGYRMYRPLVFFAAVGLGAAGLFWLAQVNHLMMAVAGNGTVAIDANTCTAAYPCFMPLTYSYELFLPMVNLRQVNYWLPDATTVAGRLLFAYVWFAVVAGWLAGIGVGAGVAHLINQRD